MKKAELRARIEALEARILALEARAPYTLPWVTVPGTPNMSPTWVPSQPIVVTCDTVTLPGQCYS